MKKNEAKRRESVRKANLQRGLQNRARKTGDLLHLEAVLAGRRILKLANLGSFMWCDVCDDSLNFRYLEEEKVFGLASVFSIRCHRCLKLFFVPSDDKVPDPAGKGRAMYSVNCKSAMG